MDFKIENELLAAKFATDDFGMLSFTRSLPARTISFSRSDILKIHVQTLTGERRFSYEVCKKTFSQSAHLTVHLGCHACKADDSLLKMLWPHAEGVRLWMYCTNFHRHRRSVNIGGQDIFGFFARKKINKMPEFYMIFAHKINNFGTIHYS